ncbi:MAG TPA: polymer-forming cytoskeletal protein [Xanthobacteraceae bacterium]
MVVERAAGNGRKFESAALRRAERKGEHMSTDGENRPESNTLYIGERVAVRGAAVVANAVVVDGLLEGDISAGNLLVTETGTIRGKVSVTQNADVFGRVYDRLDVKGLLILRATSGADGNITSGALQIEQGAKINGGICSTYHHAAKEAPQPEPKREARTNNVTQMAKPLELPALEVVPRSDFAASA